MTLVVTAGAGMYATGISTSFSQADFPPPEDNADWIESLPEPFAPSEYTVTETTGFLDEKFTSSQGEQVTAYVEAPMRKDDVLEEIY